MNLLLHYSKQAVSMSMKSSFNREGISSILSCSAGSAEYFAKRSFAGMWHSDGFAVFGESPTVAQLWCVPVLCLIIEDGKLIKHAIGP